MKKLIYKQVSLLDYIKQNSANDLDNSYSEFEKLLSGLSKFKCKKNEWRGLIAIPPASILSTLITEFDSGTSVPLEIPMMSLFHYTAGYLLNNRIVLDDNGRTIYPDIWTQLLSPSGEGKTFAFTEIAESMPEFKDTTYNISDPESSAAFFDALKDNNNKLLYRDEWWSMLDKMNGGKTLDGVKDYMMRAYNHETLSRRTKKEGLNKIENVVISFLGISVAEPVLKRISFEDLVSGFSARFNYMFADVIDEERIVPRFKVNKQLLRDMWEDVRSRIKHKTYIPHVDAGFAFDDTLRYFMKQKTHMIGRGIVRRTVETAHKYALLYHILRGKGDVQIVSPEDYGWAARLVSLHINDLRRMTEEWGSNEYAKLLDSCERIMRNFALKYNRKITPRELTMRCRKIKNADHAQRIIEILQRDSNPQAISNSEEIA